MTKQAVLEQAKGLSKHDQIELVFDLWDLVDASEIPTTVAAEFDRRIAEDDAGQSPAVEWKVLREQLLRGEL